MVALSCTSGCGLGSMWIEALGISEKVYRGSMTPTLIPIQNKILSADFPGDP